MPLAEASGNLSKTESLQHFFAFFQSKNLPLKKMTPNKLLKIEEIYHAVLEIAPAERPSFLTNACSDDHEIRREVESLLSFTTIPIGLPFSSRVKRTS